MRLVDVPSKQPLHAIPGCSIDKRLMFAGVPLSAILNLADVGSVLVFGLAGSWLAPLFGRNGYLVAGIVLVLLGLVMLGKLRFKAPVIDAPDRRVSSFAGAYFLGLPFGLVGSACPCSIPVVLAMLLYAGSVGSPWFGAALLFVFALVRGLPLLFAGTFTGWLKEFKSIARWQPRLEKASGIVLLILGVAFIAQRFTS
jgi:cytochrome c-type biogenesis protein